MKSIILAAGGGSRLLPLTATTPKCLVSVDGRAILDHQLDAISSTCIEKAVVVGGYRVERIAAHIAMGKRDLPIELIVNPFWSVASSISSVWAAREHLDEPFLLMNGDTLFSDAILAAAVLPSPAPVTLMVEPLRTPEPDDMLVSVSGGLVRDVAKTLDRSAATHRSLGLVMSMGGDAYAGALESVLYEEDGAQAFHHAVIARLAASGQVAARCVDGETKWQEIDRPEDIGLWEGDHLDRPV